MNKETYITRKAALEAQIETLRQGYIQASAEYQIGEKVKIKSKNSETPAVLKDYRVDYNGDIDYIFYKLKKDGSVSDVRARYYLFFGDIIEKI